MAQVVHQGLARVHSSTSNERYWWLRQVLLVRNEATAEAWLFCNALYDQAIDLNNLDLKALHAACKLRVALAGCSAGGQQAEHHTRHVELHTPCGQLVRLHFMRTEDAQTWVKELQACCSSGTGVAAGKPAIRQGHEATTVAYCSWCVEQCSHTVIPGLYREEVYLCSLCGRVGRCCDEDGCNEMARVAKFSWDAKCLVHCGRMLDWGVAAPKALLTAPIKSVQLLCSWCNRYDVHSVVQHELVIRPILQCQYCNRKTSRCLNCTTGAVRAAPFIKHLYCSVCLEKGTYGDYSIQLKADRHPFGAFAPPRTRINAEVLIDGKDTFAAIAAAMEGAKSEIFISLWLIVPKIRVRKSVPPKADDRLDAILKKKAKQGVKIYVLIWYESVFGRDKFKSKENKKFLEGLHENISVVRHPMMVPFIYSHHQKFVVVDRRVAFVGGIDLAWGRYDDKHHLLTDVDKQQWWGVDYYNPRVASPDEFYSIENTDKDFFDRRRTSRMPWHDMDFMVDGAAAMDTAANFIQRWNHHRDFLDEEITMKGPGKGRKEKLRAALAKEDESGPGTCQCQLLRSISAWSGSEVTETSIYAAYLHAIEMSDHFIYLENQFFISAYGGHGVVNKISECLHQRIRRAVFEETPFKCIIIFPHPEEKGRWCLPTMQRGMRTASGILSKLEEEFPHVDMGQYIGFYMLRTTGVLNGMRITDGVFIHSKMMLVDDRVAIIGSNNINDRSFLGDRDSELAAIVSDTAETVVPMDGSPYAVGIRIHEMRVRLMAEHLGLHEDDAALTDPIRAAVLWREVAMSNTILFEQAFDYICSDRLRTWDEFVSKQPTGRKPTGVGGDKKKSGSAPTKLNHMLFSSDSQGGGSDPAELARDRSRDDMSTGHAVTSPRRIPDARMHAEDEEEEEVVAAVPGVQGFVQLFPLAFLVDEPLSMRDTVLQHEVFA